ncbi:PspC domain-containing protein [Reinekea marina]|uniref:PspC domain-containing protein n=1 Tax=Reinekea marina TaxID=1310421 RepID=A0ABV7WPN3_9GAMM|nr:PspC domain-containing protein [Reinekea marina]MDN3650562.1 PspC domain-containing protein [Reinekea marina]
MTATTDTFDTQKRAFQSKRSKGWGVGLYRNTEDAKLAGVCSGVAEYIEMEKGLLRILFLASLLFSSGGSGFLYLIGWLALAPKPKAEPTSTTTQDEEQSSEPAEL